MLIVAIVLITAALIFYTIGVWAERIRKDLRPWHAVFFGFGLISDITATLMMTRIAAASTNSDTGFAAALGAVMAVTGTVAILLMAVHLVWAVVVLVRNRENERHNFHRFSIVVWAIWLIPYLAGAIGANIR
ncbi:HsmA family protein [Salinibacterium sp. G-O1]|uniref:HsmA family protein n=1 Tax=Salinibacterium sp. G-O1 TaxID=3046208 RepID=UPI0024B94872|nr:HsmA family protein [Salinibacterium sp. G-O1]MDJ0335478.1 HsmA family protein [Salinibacterium sp. G-O1]